MNVFDSMVEKLKQNPKTLVFTEGFDPRILEATDKILKEGFIKPILIGKKDN